MIRLLPVLALMALAACASTPKPEREPRDPLPLYPNETPEIRALVNHYADLNEIPRPLLHRVIQRESHYRPHARNGPYYGMMQILPATARSMGFRGSPKDLLDAETNLKYATRYLRGAWLVSGGDKDAAVMWYARGYYYAARDQCLLVETGLSTRETNRSCRN